MNNDQATQEAAAREARLQEMLDHHEIRKVLSIYCHGCDRGDAALMGSVYLADSWDDHGPLQAPGPEFAQVMMRRILEDTDALYHQLGQSLIRTDGDVAHAETYFFAVAREADEHGAPLCNQLGGRFVDTLERVGDTWKIRHRIAVRDWSISLPIVSDWDARFLRMGARATDDPATAHLDLRSLSRPS